ncbi:hypothetical protein AAFN86_13070 [Roseomonas sp. CAU 1739]|uniref:hypothetical protein n=1 Tax=Roseomonas sp. CAU 1739 TaxID=3140364 RepID=UPI00325BC8AC
MDRLLMDTAAENFDDAGGLSGAAQMQRLLLGLEQMARAARVGSRNALLLATAAENFEDAQNLAGAEQMQRLCLGLEQFARAL